MVSLGVWQWKAVGVFVHCCCREERKKKKKKKGFYRRAEERLLKLVGMEGVG